MSILSCMFSTHRVVSSDSIIRRRGRPAGLRVGATRIDAWPHRSENQRHFNVWHNALLIYREVRITYMVFKWNKNGKLKKKNRYIFCRKRLFERRCSVKGVGIMYIFYTRRMNTSIFQTCHYRILEKNVV